MPVNRHIFAALLLAAATLAQGEIRTESEVQAGASDPEPKGLRVAPGHVAATRLREFVAPKAEVDAPGRPPKIGHAREVGSLAAPGAASRSLSWEPASEGRRRAAFSVTSPGASATRLALRIDHAPADAVLRFYPPSGESPFVVPFAEIAAQLRAGASAAQADTLYWTPVVEGDTQVVEIEVAAGGEREVRLAVPAVSHLVTSPGATFAMPKAAASCTLDAMCYAGEWAAEADSVARIVFTDGGSSYLCSGTLLADRDASTTIPYLLTANHCVSTQAIASTVQTYWFYRSTACDSGVRGNYTTRAGGAALLYASANTDTAFMRLNATPPAGVTYAGWAVGSVPPFGAPTTGLHHPTGDLLKISFGRVRGYYQCTPTDEKAFTCNGASSSSATFYSVNWERGITQGGSSGSGLFLDKGRYLIGQLYGGSGGCGEASHDYYGRLDVAYGAGLSRWLGDNPQSTPSHLPEFDYSDLWWNPAESGWGLALTQHGSSMFAAWYAYDGRGQASWLVMPGGTWTSATSITGDLYATTGPDARGSFDPNAVTRTRVGSATLAFSARDRGTLSYTVNGVSGTKSISRQLFGTPTSAPVPSYGDLWWVPSESGWGLTITQQYRQLFVVWYAYRNGAPTWYVMPAGTWSDSQTWTGAVYRTSYPHPFFGSGFDPRAVGTEVAGSLALRFNGSTSATMTYTVDGVSGSKSISRQPF